DPVVRVRMRPAHEAVADDADIQLLGHGLSFRNPPPHFQTRYRRTTPARNACSTRLTRTSRCHIFADVNLNAAPGGFLSSLDKLRSDALVDVLLAAIGTNARWNSLDDESHSAALQRHRGLAGLRFRLFANHAGHDFLFLKCDSHSLRKSEVRSEKQKLEEGLSSF